MIINANAFYQESVNGEVQNKIKAKLQVYSGSMETDETARGIARAMYHSMVRPVPMTMIPLMEKEDCENVAE